jgi:tetratricopeptide (TPR) repeat protein
MIAQLPATSAEMSAEARQFFERGEALFRRGRYDAALTAFTAAYNYVRIPEIAYNLAMTSERLGRIEDAILFYRDYLRLRRNSPDRASIEEHIRELRERPPPPPTKQRRR